ncbi:SDR family oxidoreductase [Nemorincola caseinilytica]|uniref:SDR family oxidoreductase n=2 Tax=Nemorincola caseinilytica TaxID=2054315 RepID=A0ABP8N8J6_9BACT
MGYYNNKIVIITGASSGIGKALAEAALAGGAKVAVCARNSAKLREMLPASDSLLCFQADVSREADCTAFITAVTEKWGGADVLINNAGISMRALFDEADPSVIRELMDVNFWGTVYCTKAALPHIMRSKGVVVGVSSIAGYRGLPARTGYSASKFAMQGFLEALRTELLHTGTHIMWVSPGFTASNIRNVARTADGSAQAETPLDEKKLMSAEECARIILDAIEKRKRSVIMTSQGKLTVWLNKLLPSLADKLVYKHFLNEPDSPLKKYN